MITNLFWAPTSCVKMPNLFGLGKGGRLALFISRLSQRISPAAITWLVVSRRVDSVKRAAFRAKAHILSEVFIDSPLCAHRNTFCAVTRVAGAARVHTALHHGVPRSVGLCLVLPVAGCPALCYLCAKTPARLDFSRAKAVYRSNMSGAAIAPTKPEGDAPTLFACRIHGKQPAKTLHRYVFDHVQHYIKMLKFLKPVASIVFAVQSKQCFNLEDQALLG